MKNFKEFLLEKNKTGVNQNIVDLTSYILNFMKDNKIKRKIFFIDDLVPTFPFLSNWNYRSINVYIDSSYSNKTAYLKYSNSVGIFLKSYNRAALNHELMHVLQSTISLDVLLIDYENRSLLLQIKSFFKKHVSDINLLDSLLYISDEREMGAFIHSFKKYSDEKKINILSHIILLKNFDLKNLIEDKHSLNQFITIWYKYYDTSIPLVDRLMLRRNLRRDTLEIINDDELNDFIDFINKKLNTSGTNGLRKISNQYNDSEEDVEKLIKLLDKAKLNIADNTSSLYPISK